MKDASFFFYKRLGEELKKHFLSVEIENDILIFIDIK